MFAARICGVRSGDPQSDTSDTVVWPFAKALIQYGNDEDDSEVFVNITF